MNSVQSGPLLDLQVALRTIADSQVREGLPNPFDHRRPDLHGEIEGILSISHAPRKAAASPVNNLDLQARNKPQLLLRTDTILNSSLCNPFFPKPSPTSSALEALQG